MSVLGKGLITVTLSLLVALPTGPGLAADNGNDETPGLMAVYQLAVDNDPRIAQARARLDQAREARPQARAALLPSVSLTAAVEQSRQDGEQIGFDAQGNLGLQDIETTVDSTSYGIEVRQTLFRWDRWVGLSEADARVAQAESEYEGALQDLLIRTAGAYFDLLAAKDTLDTRRTTREAFEMEKERAEFAREVGTASRTDVEEARAAHDRALSDEIAAEREVEVAREALLELTGRYLRDVKPPVREVEPRLPDPEDIDFWVSRALETNPELKATEFVAEASQQRVRQARGGRYPTLDLVASRRWVDTSSDDNPFVNRDTVDDNIQLQLNVPLFTGGENTSRIREARAAEREAWSGVKLATREVRRETRDSFLGIRSGVARVSALRQAVRSGETAVEATEVGVEVGSRSTVDLLNARRELANARAELSQVRYAYLLDTLRLQRAVGQLDVNELERLSGLFTGSPGEDVHGD
ncbi:TolC family outer membrane protein [Natronospira sp.]|uniref:TolC family outer membrane protein n=1 Tax=Natronospira sp. TaxID=2024970 RepID=UPI003873566E